MPTIVVSGVIEKLTHVPVDSHLHFPPEGFVCLWWYAIESRSFAWPELVDGLIHFTKRDRAINFHQLFSRGDKVEDPEVNWSMITEHTFEVRAKDSHILATVGCQSSIRKLLGGPQVRFPSVFLESKEQMG